MLARVYENKIVYPVYKEFVNICGRYLFNPTEQMYRDLGFEELPTLEEKEGYHTKYSIATRTVEKEFQIKVPRQETIIETDEEGNEATREVTVYDDGTEIRSVEEQYIVAEYEQDEPIEEEDDGI